MSAPILLLTKRLMLGAFPLGSVVVSPGVAHLGILAGFAQVTPDPLAATTATFTVYRTGGDDTLPYTVTYTVVPAAVNGVTSAYLADPTVLLGKNVTIPAGQPSVPVSVTFAAHAPPSADLGGDVVLSGAGAGEVVDAAAASFSFAVLHQTVVNGSYDLGAGGNGYTDRWTPQLGGGSGIVVTQEPNGIVVDCASAGNVQTATDVAAILWGKTPLPSGAWRATVSLTQLDGNVATQVNGVYFQVFPGFTGGRNGSDANPNNWTTAQYRDAALALQANSGVLDKYGTGLRASLDQDGLNLANSDRLRVHDIKSDGTEGNLGGASYDAAFTVDKDVVYTLEIEWKPVAGTLTWTKTSSAGGVEQVVISDPLVATWIGQYLGFGVSAVRKVRIGACTVVPITETVTGTDPQEDDPTQWATITGLASVPSGSKVAVSAVSQLASTAGGKVYVIGSDLSGTSVTVDGTGTKGGPVEIRGDLEGATKRKLSLNTLVIQNASHVYFRDLDLGDTQVVFSTNWDHVSFERCQTYGRTGGIDNASFMIDSAGKDAPGRYIRVRYHQHGKTGVSTTAGMFRLRGARQANYLFPNHPRYIYLYKNRYTNVDDHPTAFQCIITFCGDNDRDWYRDVQLSIYDSLIDGCNCPIITELKPQGCWVSRITYERGTGGFPAYMRNRHSANRYVGNLFVTRASSPAQGGRGGITIRDRGCVVLNNHAYTLADGTQPTLSSPPGAGGDKIGLFTGTLDASLYPTNEGDGAKGSLWPDAMGTKCGGNNMPVIVGDDGGGPLPAVGCVVPPAGGGRVDRNRSVTVTSDKDFAGRGKYRLAATGSPVYVGPPAYGTLTGTGTTDTTTSLVPDGADITKVPHRWLQAEVGPGAGP